MKTVRVSLVRVYIGRHANPALRVPTTLYASDDEMSGDVPVTVPDPGARELVGTRSTRYGLVNPDRAAELRRTLATRRAYTTGSGNPDTDSADDKNANTGQLFYLDTLARQGDASVGFAVGELLNKGSATLGREFLPDVILTSAVARTRLTCDSMLKHYSNFGKSCVPIIIRDDKLKPITTKPEAIWKAIHAAVQKAVEAKPSAENIDVALIVHDTSPLRALTGAGVKANPPHYFGQGHQDEWMSYAPLASGYIFQVGINSVDDLKPRENPPKAHGDKRGIQPEVIIPARDKIQVIGRIEPHKSIAKLLGDMSAVLNHLDESSSNLGDKHRQLPGKVTKAELKLISAEFKKISEFVHKTQVESFLEVDAEILGYLYCNETTDKEKGGMTRLYALSKGMAILGALTRQRIPRNSEMFRLMKEIGSSRDDKIANISLMEAYTEIKGKERIITRLYEHPEIVRKAQRSNDSAATSHEQELLDRQNNKPDEPGKQAASAR